MVIEWDGSPICCKVLERALSLSFLVRNPVVHLYNYSTVEGLIPSHRLTHFAIDCKLLPLFIVLLNQNQNKHNIQKVYARQTVFSFVFPAFVHLFYLGSSQFRIEKVDWNYYPCDIIRFLV